MAGQELTISEKVADHAADLAYTDITAPHQDRLHDLVLDVLGCAVAGIGEPVHDTVLNLVGGGDSDGDVTVIAGGTTTAPSEAVFANSVAAHVLTFDDRHGDSSTHPGSIVVPAAIAVGESVDASGRDVLTGVFAGYEIIGKLGKVHHGFDSDLPRRPTPVFGPLGAAVAASVVLDLDHEQIANAIGFAANLGGGMSQVWIDGEHEYVFHAGFAAKNGVMAAQLAERSMATSDRSLEGPKGFYKAFFGDVPDELPEVVSSFGQDSELDNVICKPHPACGVAVVPIQLAERLRNDGHSHTDIAHLNVTVSGVLRNIPGTTSVESITTPTQALMSVPFCVASTLVLEDGFSRRALTDHRDDPAVMDMLDRTQVTFDDSFYKYRCKIEAELADGTAVQIGAAEQSPLTRSDIERKFSSNVSQHLSPAAVESLSERIHRLEAKDSVGDLLEPLETIR